MKVKHNYQFIVTLVVFLVVLTLWGCVQNPIENSQNDRQLEVAKLGATVMPFDLDKTTHIFQKTENGGVQKVVSDEPNNAEQIKLIRDHLSLEAERFMKGNFHDPTMIHGEKMAGLHELVMGAKRIKIQYSELPDGAQIVYTTDDPTLVRAIHAWFDAQLTDHGKHAKDH